MRVLHIYKDYPPVMGGIENHLRMLAEGQAAKGLDVTVLVTARGVKTTESVENGVRVIRAGRLGQVSSTPLSSALCNRVRQLSPDLTHLQVPYPLGELAHTVFGNGNATVATYQCDFTAQRVLGLAYRPVLRRVLRRADRIIVTSPQYAHSSAMLRPVSDKCTIVPLAIETGRWVTRDESRVAAIRQQFRAHGGASVNLPIVLFVGRLRHYKGVEYLIDATKSVEATLLVVGAGPMRKQLERRARRTTAAERIHFLGEVPEGELNDYYAAADVVVLPSSVRSEAFGMVLLEAMASGTPVISTELGTGTSFVNRDGETGLVVPPRDPGALARAISELVGDRPRLEKMGRRARERVREQFAVGPMLDAVVDVYRAALDKRAAGVSRAWRPETPSTGSDAPQGSVPVASASVAAAPVASALGALSEVQRSILLTVLYSDIFDYPLRREELGCYLVGLPTDRAGRPGGDRRAVPAEQFDAELAAMIGTYLSEASGMVFWKGREQIVELRRQRHAICTRRWPQARRYARWLAQVPFVRMVGVCGSQAVENADENGDIDLFLITAPKRLWLVQATAMFLRRVARLSGARVCPNYLLTTASLELEERNLYTAREAAQMVPLWGGATYDSFLDANRWIAGYLPRWNPSERRHRLERRPDSRLAEFFERLLVGRFGEALDAVAYRVLIAYYTVRLRLRRITGEALRRAYRRDRQLVVTGGFSAAVAEHFAQRASDRLGDEVRKSDLAALFPGGRAARCRESSRASARPVAHPVYSKLFEDRYGRFRRDEMLPDETPPDEMCRDETRRDKVLFGQSYYLRFDPKLWRAMQPYPPLGTLYAAAYLRDRGYDVALFDAMLAESEEEWAAALDRERPRYAVIYEDNFNYLSKMCLLRMRHAAFRMIEMARARGCTVIVCGSDATDHAELYLQRGAHYALIGEGEETLAQLLDRLVGRSRIELAAIRGLKMTNGNGGISSTGPRPVLRELDDLPRPAWDLVDFERYRSVWMQRHGRVSINMATTRGCPFHCNWCAKPIWGQIYNVRSPNNVVEEMEFLRDELAVEHIWFADDIMGLKPGWLEEFARLVEERDVGLPYKCLSRVDLLLRGVEIESLRRSGCEIVWVGAESGSQKILDAMEKGTRIEEIREVARRLRQAGVRVGFFLQFGYPGETRQDIEMTRQLVRDCEPDEIGISVSYPLPGTRFYEFVKDRLGEKQNWINSEDLDPMYEGPFSSAFYRKLYEVVQKEFRLRKAHDDLALAVQRPGVLRRHRPGWLPHRLGAALFHSLTLPLDRGRLERLSRLQNLGISEIPAHMAQRESATPTPQQDSRAG